MGVLSAGPVADGYIYISSCFISKRNKSLKEGDSTEEKISNIKTIEEKNTSTPVIITIAREYGSGGRYIGKLVAEKLGIKLYDKNIIENMAEIRLSENILRKWPKKKCLDVFNNGYYVGLNNADELFIKESEFIKKVASEESCIIVGRCADFILKDNKNTIKIFINNSMENKVKRATEFYHMNKEKAEKEISRINKLRANHYKYYTEKDWKEPSNYWYLY